MPRSSLVMGRMATASRGSASVNALAKLSLESREDSLGSSRPNVPQHGRDEVRRLLQALALVEDAPLSCVDDIGRLPFDMLVPLLFGFGRKSAVVTLLPRFVEEIAFHGWAS